VNSPVFFTKTPTWNGRPLWKLTEMPLSVAVSTAPLGLRLELPDLSGW
jgi:hypothetical protein